jgi:hypothetical protein
MLLFFIWNPLSFSLLHGAGYIRTPPGECRMLIFKLLLTPIIIGLVSLAGRRWGPAVSGWLVGLPLTSAPVVLFLAVEQGRSFASAAAQGTLLGQISGASFCLAYSWISLRLGWLYSLLTGWCVFFILTAALEHVSVPLILAFLGAICFLAIVLKLLPASQQKVDLKNPPAWEIPLRMLVATGIVLILTGVAGLLGPQLSGLLTTFPMYASILGAFSHRFQGSIAARRLLRGVVTGLFTFAVFFLIVASTIERWGIAPAFILAILAALLIHGSSFILLRKYVTGV